jgi:hypothetical protein
VGRRGEAIEAGVHTDGKAKWFEQKGEGHIAPLVEGDGGQEPRRREDAAPRSRLAGPGDLRRDSPAQQKDRGRVFSRHIAAKQDIASIVDDVGLEDAEERPPGREPRPRGRRAA